MGIKLVSVILKQVFFILAKQQDILIVKSKLTLVNGDLIWDASD